MFTGREDFARLREGFAEARARRPEAFSGGRYRFVHRPVSIDVVGIAAARVIAAAFAPLARADGMDASPSLRIEVWDEEETGVMASVRSAGVGVSGDGVVVAAGSESWTGAYDRAAGHLVAVVRTHARLACVDRARPFERLLLVWYADQGCSVLHAGMVADDRGSGIVIAGAGRSGKSTAVFACLNAGLAALGDDCIAVQREAGGAFTGFSVFSALLVDPLAIRSLGGIAAAEPDDARGRAFVPPPPRIPAAMCANASVRAIVLPRIRPGASSTLEPIGRGEALRTLLPTALGMDPLGMGTRRGFDVLTALLDRVPCYRLIAGADLHALATAVRQALPRDDRCAS